ncbi:MAG: hypothetical protein ACOYNI_05550 [Acidimicrobiia bacterium]
MRSVRSFVIGMMVLALGGCGGGKSLSSARSSTTSSPGANGSSTTSTTATGSTAKPTVPTVTTRTDTPDGFVALSGPHLVIAVPKEFTPLDPAAPDFTSALDKIAAENQTLAASTGQVKQAAADGTFEVFAADPATGASVQAYRNPDATSLSEATSELVKQLDGLSCTDQSIERIAIGGDEAVRAKCTFNPVNAVGVSGADVPFGIALWAIQHGAEQYTVALGGPASAVTMDAGTIEAGIRFR